MIKDMIESLKNNHLFTGVELSTLSELFSHINYKMNSYSKNETIAIEGSECTSLGIVLEGHIEIQKLYPSGRVITVDRLAAGSAFGEVIVFSAMHKYPSTIVSCENSKILFIPKMEVAKLCSENMTMLNNFMSILSNKILMLNKKVRTLSLDSLRAKTCNLLLEECKKQKSTTVTMPMSRKEMADFLGVQRPSLSRELVNMQDEGLIKFDKNIVRLLDVEALEEYL